MRWCVIATMALAALCDRPAPMKIEDVHVSARNSQLVFPEDPSLQSVTFAVHQERVGVGQSGALSDDYSC